MITPAPLPGPPDPWRSSEMPAWRDGPPYLMTEMIAAEPALAGRIARRLQADPVLARVADALREAARRDQPITITGCGTSQHAAMAVAAVLADGLRRAELPSDRVAAVQAFELSRHVPAGGVVVAVSHEGGTAATNQAVLAATNQGTTTVLITVSDRSPGAALADHVLHTDEQDQSWCHTVGYLSPLVVGACLHGALLGPTDEAMPSPDALEGLLASAADPAAAERAAAALGVTDRVIVVGSGADHASARELALKIEEGAHLPATAHELETIRHGHLAAASERTGCVLILTDAEARGTDLRDRAGAVLRSAAAIGMPAAAIVAEDVSLDPGLTTAGQLTVGVDPVLPRIVAGVLGAAIPLQLLAERLARARGTNPDTIGREDPRQAAAGEA